MIQLLLDPDFSYEGLFDFAAAEGLLFDFLNSNLYASWLMASKLYFTIWTFAKVRFLRLDELQVVLLDVRKQLL